jgi:hypothetical protein
LCIRVRPFVEVNERCAASHLTAAELLDLPRRRQKEPAQMFHVIRPEGAAHLNRPHVMGDSCVRIPRVEFEGRDTPLCTLGDLQRVIDRHKGKRGLRKAKLAIQLIRIGSDSPQESLLRLAITSGAGHQPFGTV